MLDKLYGKIFYNFRPGVCMCLMDDPQCAKQFVRDVSDFTALAVHHATSPETLPPGTQVTHSTQ